ncbi:hypothetical protein E2C01_072005 [Portunus trituberculatus]|uniref:Uncharacterized protein n=1 Tax=Portunus trituberculatus TaxID=210409 RepID=A0A5B7I9J1_PORTR|nr:hypothetical protein [Portunus trituberculatus]
MPLSTSFISFVTSEVSLRITTSKSHATVHHTFERSTPRVSGFTGDVVWFPATYPCRLNWALAELAPPLLLLSLVLCFPVTSSTPAAD